MNDKRDPRRSFRITDTLHLICEALEEAEFEDGLERRRIRRGASEGLRSMILDFDARIAEKLYLLRAESPAVADCVALIHDKLAAVTSQLPAVRKARSTLAERRPQLCELGADGMRFGTAVRFEAGSKLALRFLLMPNSHYIETFCRVRRQIPAPDPEDERHPFGVAVEFLGMSSAQKEVIIQYLFNRESETLRERRLLGGNGEGNSP